MQLSVKDLAKMEFHSHNLLGYYFGSLKTTPIGMNLINEKSSFITPENLVFSTDNAVYGSYATAFSSSNILSFVGGMKCRSQAKAAVCRTNRH